MTELPDLPELATRVSNQVQAPPFEQVSRRAARRRRKRHAAILVASAVVVAGVAWGAQGLHGWTSRALHRPAAEPSLVAVSASAMRDREAIKAATVLVDFSVAPDGSIATLWSNPGTVENMVVAVKRVTGSTWTTVSHTGMLGLISVPGGWLLNNPASADRPLSLLSVDGTIRPVPEATLKPQGGDVVGACDWDVRCFYRPGSGDDAGQWSLLPSEVRQFFGVGVITPDGGVVVPGGHDQETAIRVWRDGATTWNLLDATDHKNQVQAGVFGSGDYVISATGGDGATSLPLGSLRLSSDQGRTWSLLDLTPWRDLGIRHFTNAVVTGQGTVLVSWPFSEKLPLEAGPLARMALGGQPELVNTSPKLGLLQVQSGGAPNGDDRIWGLLGPGKSDATPLMTHSDDQGLTWSDPTPVPSPRD